MQPPSERGAHSLEVSKIDRADPGGLGPIEIEGAEPATRTEHAVNLGKRGRQVGHVAQSVSGGHHVHDPGREGQPRDVSDDPRDVGTRPRRLLPAARQIDHSRCEIESRHASATARPAKREIPGAAGEIELPDSRLETGQAKQALLPMPVAAEREKTRDEVVASGNRREQSADVPSLCIGRVERPPQRLRLLPVDHRLPVRSAHHNVLVLPSQTVENYLKTIFLAQAADPTAGLVPMGQIASTLRVVPGTATTMIKALAESGLVHYEPYMGVRLTAAGEKLAGLVLRRHRLVELFLVKVLGMSWAEVHDEAEQLEHAVSERLIDRIDEMLGRPATDPHGDPIPTAEGELPPFRGQPLTELPAGKHGAIAHVEDEPREIYAQIVAEELHPGMRVEMVEVGPERVRFWADGEEHVLAPVVAANVTVLPLVEETDGAGPVDSLASLAPGEEGRVVRIAASCRGLQRRRLMDLGIVPGTEVRAEMQSTGGDPTAYRIRGTLVALREDQAKQVQISRTMDMAS